MKNFKDILSFLAKHKNKIYVFLFANYILLFLVKTSKIAFFEFTSNKKLPLLVYLFWAVQSFLVKKSIFTIILTLFFILIFLVLNFIICCYIFKFAEFLRKSDKFQNKINLIKSEYLIVLFLLIFSAVIRFGFLNAGLYHHDSFQTAMAVEKTVEEHKLHGIGGGRQGIIAINSVFFLFFKAFFGHETAEFTVNFTSALFGTLSILVLYFLVKNLLNDGLIAFSSGMLYSATPIFLSVSTFAKEHTLDVFIALLSVLFLVIGLKKINYILILIAGLFLSSLIFVRFPSLLIIFSMVFLIYKNTNGYLRKLKAFSFFIAPFIISIALYSLFNFGVLANEARSNFYPLSLENMGFLFNNFKYSVSGIAFTLTVSGMILSAIGFWALFKENKKVFYFLMLLFVPLYFFYASSSTIAHRFFSLPIVALIVSLSYAICRIKKINHYAGTLALILFVTVFFMNIYPVIKLRHEFSAFKDLAFMVNANTNPQDSIVVLYGDDAPALNYYSKVPVMSCDYEPDSKMIGKFISRINEKVNSGFKVFISGACFGLGTFEERKLFRDLMDADFKGSIVAEYVSDDYHRGSIKPTIKKVSMIRLYALNNVKGDELTNLIIRH